MWYADRNESRLMYFYTFWSPFRIIEFCRLSLQEPGRNTVNECQILINGEFKEKLMKVAVKMDAIQPDHKFITTGQLTIKTTVEIQVDW